MVPTVVVTQDHIRWEAYNVINKYICLISRNVNFITTTIIITSCMCELIKVTDYKPGDHEFLVLPKTKPDG